jgi:DNA polymerase-3 subunit epsilon
MLAIMQRFAIIDTETTGFGKNDRIVEVAVVLMDETEIINEWETLVNPERDISNSDIHGITPDLVSMAPSFAEIADSLASLINDRIIVAHNISFDERMLSQEFSRTNLNIDFGKGFCTLNATGMKLQVACENFQIKTENQHRALSDARATAILLSWVRDKNRDYTNLKPVKVKNFDSSRVPKLVSRAAISSTFKPAQQNLRRVLKHIDLDSRDTREDELSYLDSISSIMSDFVISEDERKQLSEWASVLGLSDNQVKTLHKKFLDSLIESAKKDNFISDLEADLIQKASSALGVEVEEYNKGTEDNPATYLRPGKKICFTGKAVDKNGEEIFRETLELYAEKLGLIPTQSVTKKNCDVLVAQDKASMSGKAKKARDFDIPVISVDDFFQVYYTKKITN